MAGIKGFFSSLLVWSYERGTLQYDVICALILAFIFFVPRGCFAPKHPSISVDQAVSGHTTSRPVDLPLETQRGNGK